MLGRTDRSPDAGYPGPVAVYDIGDDLVLGEPSVTPIAELPDRRSFPSFAWTERAIVVEARTDGRASLVLRVERPVEG